MSVCVVASRVHKMNYLLRTLIVDTDATRTELQMYCRHWLLSTDNKEVCT